MKWQHTISFSFYFMSYPSHSTCEKCASSKELPYRENPNVRALFSFSSNIIRGILYTKKNAQVNPNAFQHIYCYIRIVRNALIVPKVSALYDVDDDDQPKRKLMHLKIYGFAGVCSVCIWQYCQFFSSFFRHLNRRRDI